MIHSQRDLENYLMIDNRANGGGLMETAVSRCSHCHAQVVLNPDRTRPREYCSKCDKYICDGCAATRKGVDECVPLDMVIDDLREAAFREEQQQRGSILLSPKGNL
jgi:hypothetical protein